MLLDSPFKQHLWTSFVTTTNHLFLDVFLQFFIVKYLASSALRTVSLAFYDATKANKMVVKITYS
jgi:hypothetical protein